MPRGVGHITPHNNLDRALARLFGWVNMSDLFRELVKKIGSGPHTSKPLSREESALAMQMMLKQEATPAQIGAFLIAHRIKRPTAEELAGLLDAYNQLGPKLSAIDASYPTIVMGSPYDGRSRTTPLSPIVALMLSAMDCPVIMHGGRQMPTKYGIPLVDVWQGWGIDWTRCSLRHVQQVFEKTYVGFVYLPTHFPLADGLVPYRDQIGKRPPVATLELMWCPYGGKSTIVAGYVHPPTEDFMIGALNLHDTPRFILIKGLEGSCDLPRDRTCIISIHDSQHGSERLKLHPRDYGYNGSEAPLVDREQLIQTMETTLNSPPGELMSAAIWNGGFYLWQSGICADLPTGLAKAQDLLESGNVIKQLKRVQDAIDQLS